MAARQGQRRRTRHLIATLPATALVVADAGFHGDDPATAIPAAWESFLIRMSSQVRPFVDMPADRERFDQGEVWYWPTGARRGQLPPSRLRLKRVRGRHPGEGRRREAENMRGPHSEPLEETPDEIDTELS